MFIIFTKRYGKSLMDGVSKRKKHIKKLAEKKRNKHVQVAEININVEDNEEKMLVKWKVM